MKRIGKFISKFNAATTSPITLEIVRILPMILIVFFAFWPDLSSFLIVKYVFGFLFAIGLLVHFLRKMLFPYIDMREFAAKALEEAQSSAIIFFSVSLIICTIIYSTTGFFKN
jgi:hypothetical protein